MTYPSPPKSFLQAIVHDLSTSPPLITLCAGYEAGVWRGEALAEHAIEWLPEFCLSEEELREFHPGNAIRLIRQAARLVYQTDKYKLRGEFGELFLHIALRQIYHSIPAISKIYWKDSVNNTVKGFDAVHVVEFSGKLELWLGEVKFYEDAKQAIVDVVAELETHTAIDYLKNEFMLITNKLDKQATHYQILSQLLDQNTSLDKVFDAACIPVLITYDSKTVKGHSKSDDIYQTAIQNEVTEILKRFKSKLPVTPLPMKLHLFLIPVHTKSKLVEQLDHFLKRWQ